VLAASRCTATGYDRTGHSELQMLEDGGRAEIRTSRKQRTKEYQGEEVRGMLGACPLQAANFGWRAPTNPSTSITDHHDDVPSPRIPNPPPRCPAVPKLCRHRAASASTLVSRVQPSRSVLNYPRFRAAPPHRRHWTTHIRRISRARALRTAREPAMVCAPSSPGGAPGIHAAHAPRRLEPNLRPALSYWPRAAFFFAPQIYIAVYQQQQPPSASAALAYGVMLIVYSRAILRRVPSPLQRASFPPLIFADRPTLCLRSKHEE
jgi:hypothetical protein